MSYSMGYSIQELRELQYRQKLFEQAEKEVTKAKKDKEVLMQHQKNP